MVGKDPQDDLNEPSSANPGYQPFFQGMQTALPYVDNLLPANTSKGLKAMGKTLAAQSAKG